MMLGFLVQREFAVGHFLLRWGASSHFSETLFEKVYGYNLFLCLRLYLDSGTGSVCPTLSRCCKSSEPDSKCSSSSSSESIFLSCNVGNGTFS